MNIRFDETTSDELGLILTEKTIGMPAPETVTIKVPGSNEIIDMSTALTGFITYGRRQLDFVFESFERGQDRERKRSEIIRALHGRVMKIMLDDTWYYKGRVTVSMTDETYRMTTKVTADADPYRRKAEETSVSSALTQTEKSLALTNEEMRVVPEIVVTGTAQITFAGKTLSLSAGTYRSPDIMLEPGTNQLRVKGSGTVTFRYREGRL